MERYSIIKEKNPREIVLLRGKGCAYKKCSFCDYHTDCCDNEQDNYTLNSSVLEKVTGIHHQLEVINSGSVFELDSKTLNSIRNICTEKEIGTIHFESHYMYRRLIPKFRNEFSDLELKMKLGLETFDYNFRENVLCKGISEKSPAAISKDFDEANFLFGLSGQTTEQMKKDIELGLQYFERICVNIMCKNSTQLLPDSSVIFDFMQSVYPLYKDNQRVDILINNTDFGVGD